MRAILRAILVLLPWSIRRPLLTMIFGYDLDPTSYIGWAWIYPRHLVMGSGSRIGHLTVAVHLDKVLLEAYATIGRGNWITGFPTGTESPHFQSETSRRAELIVEEHAAITNRHLIDCTSQVVIGRFATFAGFASQILSHSIDLEENRQASAPVSIGSYSFVGTNCVLLGGSTLPERSVLAAKSLLNKAHVDSGWLYGGVPSQAIKRVNADAAYFHREAGRVD